jgi:hypothetical protein
MFSPSLSSQWLFAAGLSTANRSEQKKVSSGTTPARSEKRVNLFGRLESPASERHLL